MWWVMADSILIVDLGFQPDQLRLIAGCLEACGYTCVLFKALGDISDVSPDQQNTLILVGTTNSGIHSLRQQIQILAKDGNQLPILVCFTDDCSFSDEELLALEVDDFSFSPVNANRLLVRVRRLLKQREPKTDQSLPPQIEHHALSRVIGQAPAFAAVKKQILRLAGCDVTVLITGETGTGKEMFARAIHNVSDRVSRPFIPVNCSAIPTELFENELFGHEPGAYTDARQQKRGLIAEAEGGTLFLDEVDSLHPLAQVKLLRFLQDRQYKPLGASSYKKANVRLLTATNQDLRKKIQEGSFREDLYYRIKIVSLSLPSLRERLTDIPSLASHFLTVAMQDYGRSGMRFTPDAILKLTYYGWPGNVRELENVIRQAVVMAEGPVISARNLKLQSEPQTTGRSAEGSFNEAKARVITAFERNYLQQVLSASNGNISQAARDSRKDRRTFFELLKKHDLLGTHKLHSEQSYFLQGN